MVNGASAYIVEQAVKARLVRRGICPYLTRDLMPRAGYTETVDADEITVADLKQMIQEETIRLASG
jgi:hypothetical protein